MEIKIKYFDGAKELKRISKGDWVDIYSNEDIFIPEGEMRLIHLGIAMQLPEGYEAHVCPRSSTFKTWGIVQANNMGIIDNSYCGDSDEWLYPAFCLLPKSSKIEGGLMLTGTWIHKGDKIAQFRIMENQPEIEFTTVEHLDNPDRSGFGSTGDK